MSIRLQVLFDDNEMRAVRDAARRRGVSVSAWVRDVLREARAGDAGGDVERKLDAVRSAVEHEFPTADVEELLAQIERGYGTAPSAR
jgi:hypothetical protein